MKGYKTVTLEGLHLLRVLRSLRRGNREQLSFMRGKQISPRSLSSLAEKNLVRTDGETYILTPQGAKVLEFFEQLIQQIPMQGSLDDYYRQVASTIKLDARGNILL